MENRIVLHLHTYTVLPRAHTLTLGTNCTGRTVKHMSLHTLEDKAFSQTCTPSDATCTCQCLKRGRQAENQLARIRKLKTEVRQVKRGHA